ncbi:type IIB DNA topoisomerase [Colletotrichum cuscutae]|uniref:DNA topoisomerase (ATP-hydrolyzing) n=1 Tax=Colletotrichum cuscutae TaxID=1209917 RepID=A0AAI9UQZ6_9PEZI|nr:type IIB DNA topoisomerase [Colletotrichum cuscutae]
MDFATPPLLNGRREGQLTPQLSNPSQSSNVVTIPDPDPHGNAIGLAIVKLEDILISARESLLQSREISIPFRTRPSTNQSTSNHGPSRTTRLAVRFPGRTAEEATKFSSYSCLVDGNLFLTFSRYSTYHAHHATVPERPDGRPADYQEVNIYYQDTDLFKRQSIVDKLVDDLAFTLGLGREDLGIVAASKGLVSGPIILRSRTSEVDASSSEHVWSTKTRPQLLLIKIQGILIPSARTVSEIDFGPAHWVLVIEKEVGLVWCWLQNIADWNRQRIGHWHRRGTRRLQPLAWAFLSRSGKGYPDLNTKQFVHLLHTAKPELPIFALVDFDCYGIAIMRCYSYGTRGHAHEKATTVPSMQWLGIRSDDLAFRQDATPSHGPDINGSQRRPGASLFDSTSSLTLRDRTRAINTIKEIEEDGTENDQDCRRELQVMLFLGIKAEIQAVDNAGDMSRWLDEHLGTF